MTLYAAYAFNEGSGTTILDYSGNSRNMTVTGSNSWITGHGSYANAFQSGSTASDGASYATASDEPLLSGDVTVMAWYKHTGANGTSICHLGGLYGGSGTARLALWTYRSLSGVAASPEFTVRDSVGTIISAGANGTTADTNWHHGAMVYHSSGLMEVYLDGSLVSSSSPTTNPIGALVNDVAVGFAWSGAGSQAVTQDLRIFSSALTSTNITTYMNTPVVAPPATGPSLIMAAFP